MVTEVATKFVTVTSTTPAAPAGALAVMVVGELTTKETALVEPNLTASVPAKLVPVMVTEVPPAVGPFVGLTEVTTGVAS